MQTRFNWICLCQGSLVCTSFLICKINDWIVYIFTVRVKCLFSYERLNSLHGFICFDILLMLNTIYMYKNSIEKGTTQINDSYFSEWNKRQVLPRIVKSHKGKHLHIIKYTWWYQWCRQYHNNKEIVSNTENWPGIYRVQLPL